jgi:hypothetical protein
LRIPSSSRSPDHDHHRTFYYLGYPLGRFAGLKHRYQWKLNPNKCVFGVPSGKLLGFIISHRGIEANPEKISAITKMKAPTCIKDVQKLTGCMAALNIFISKLGEWGLCRCFRPATYQGEYLR